MIECVLFDSDGTLVDSEFICNKAIAIKFQELGVKLDVEQVIHEFRGGKMLEVLDMPVAVVSNGPKKKVMQALEICGLRHYFNDNIYSAYELQCWKPNAGLYLNAAKDMGINASQCAVVEDSPTGVQAGINANMTTCYYDTLNQPIMHDKVIHFNSMHNLIDILKGI